MRASRVITEADIKKCSKCGTKFPNSLEYFRKKVGCLNNLSAQCVYCERERDRLYHEKKSKDPKGYIQQYKKFNNGYNLYISRVYNAHKLREQDLRDLMDKQKGCCFICRRSLVNPKFSKSDMHVDHNHTTGRVRGLLCCNCNHLVGVCKEDIEILQGAINYIEYHHVLEDK